MRDAERDELSRYVDGYVDLLEETLLAASQELAIDPRNKAARQPVTRSSIELLRFLDIRAKRGR